MAQALTLPILAGLSLLGTAAGVQLGSSAISEINPAYFQAHEDRFHADLVPNPGRDWAQVQVAEYQAAQQPALFDGLGSGCVGCRAYPEEYVPRHDTAVDGYQDGWSASAAYAAPAEAAPAVLAEQEPDPERVRVVRYASYPVSAEEQDEALSPEDEDAREVHASTQ